MFGLFRIHQCSSVGRKNSERGRAIERANVRSFDTFNLCKFNCGIEFTGSIAPMVDRRRKNLFCAPSSDSINRWGVLILRPTSLLGELNMRGIQAGNWLALVFAAIVFGMVHPVGAVDAGAGKEVAQLLDIGWQTTVKSRPEADGKYAQVVRAGAGFEGDYAYFLVLLQQRRYSEVTKQGEQLVKIYPKNVTAWRGLMWAATLTKNYQGAMAAGEKYAELLALESADPNLGTSVRDNTEFLGRMYGYLGGPAGEQVKQEERKAAEKRVLEHLPAELHETFTAAREAVIGQYLQLANMKTDEREKALANAEVEKQKTLEDLDKQRERIDSKKGELQDDFDRAEAEFKAEIAALERQDLPLQTQLANLQIQFTRVEGELATILNQIAILDQQFRNERDPIIRDAIRRDIQFLDLSAARVRSNLVAVDQQIGIVQSQRASLAAKANVVQQAFNNAVGRVNQTANQLNKDLKKADTIERIAKQPAKGNTTRVTAINAQATALTTYQPFPLEQEKLRLLEQLK